MKLAGMNYKVLERSEEEILLEINLATDFEYFEGHFEEFKLLAALIQIKLSIDFANEFFPIKLNPTSIPKVKCSNPIKPNNDIKLSLKWNKNKSLMSFEYFDNLKSYSQGDLSL